MVSMVRGLMINLIIIAKQQHQTFTTRSIIRPTHLCDEAIAVDAVVMNKLGKGWETGLRRHKVLRITRMITFGTDDDLQNDDDDDNDDLT